MTKHTAQLMSAECRALLGESPVWDERTQRLYWVDTSAAQCIMWARTVRRELRPDRTQDRMHCAAASCARVHRGTCSARLRTSAWIPSRSRRSRPSSLIFRATAATTASATRRDASGLGTCDDAMKSASGWFVSPDGRRWSSRGRSGPSSAPTGPPSRPTGASSTASTATAARCIAARSAPRGTWSTNRSSAALRAMAGVIPTGSPVTFRGVFRIGTLGRSTPFALQSGG